MTLVGIATYEDRVEILTDTFAYGPLLRRTGHTSKVEVLPHIDAAVAGQGSSYFTLGVKAEAAASMMKDFDALQAVLPQICRDVWQHVDQPAEGTIFLAGYSESSSAFVAYRHLAENNFEPEPIKGLHIMPSPYLMPINAFEADRMRAEAGDAAAELKTILADWSAVPPRDAPADLIEWGTLALAVREQRTVKSPPKIRVMVAGKLVLTQIERGLIVTNTILDFDDEGELEEMVAGTLHPRAQVGLCQCESGKAAIDCHIAEVADKPCLCGSEKPLRECCMLTDDQREWAATATLVC